MRVTKDHFSRITLIYTDVDVGAGYPRPDGYHILFRLKDILLSVMDINAMLRRLAYAHTGNSVPGICVNVI